MATNSHIFGWELVAKSIADEVKSKEDVLVAFVHWNLIKKKLKCLGIGESKTIGPEEKGSELLPEGWNKTSNYSIRYVQDDAVIVLHAVKCGDNMIFNILDMSNLNTSNVAIDVDKTVDKLDGPLREVIPAHEELTQKIQSNLLRVITDRTTKSTEVQTQSTGTSKSNNPETSNRRNLIHHPLPANPIYAPFSPLMIGNPANIGRADLNPFGAGGGMLFDPMRDYSLRNPEFNGLPRHSVPPRARFDPFGPPRPDDIPFGPDADHMRPPGYDDMFM